MRPSLASIGLAFALFACSKEDAKGSATAPSATASATAAAVAPTADAAPSPGPTEDASASAAALPPPKCPPGLTGNAVPAYCIKLPAGYSVKTARVKPTKGSIDYDTGSATDNLTVSYDDTPLVELSKQVEGEMKFGGDKIEKKGDLAGGGKWFKGSHAEYERIVTLIRAPPPITIKCSFAYQSKKAPPREAIDACKSIVLP
jgi:hypothetical protein